MSFQSLGLIPELTRAVAELGYITPTPIQRQAIPMVLDGHDVMGLAETGTGKTGGYTLPLLQRLNQNIQSSDKIKRVVRALILTPTRELAAQVGENVRGYSRYLSLRSEIIFGGVSINPQITKVRRGTDIIIATPGRLLDLINQNEIDLSKVEILVLDEADRMLDMGFIKDVKKILALIPKQRQNLLFSATLSKDIQGLADSLLRTPKLIEVASRNKATELVSQIVHPVDRKRKRELLSYMIGFHNWRQVLVFTRTKHGANHLCEQLIEDGLTAAAIHGNKSQGARTRALADFKSGQTRILVATDIAARGIDIDQLPYVVNFDLPNVPEDYVHRIGRTGRAGKEGSAVSLVCVDELQLLRDIERLINRQIPKEVIAGYAPDASIRAEPISNGRRSGGGAGNNRSNGRNSSNTSYERKPSTSSTERKPMHGAKSDRSPKEPQRGNWQRNRDSSRTKGETRQY
jgi:ATP-dependent RNA helicase RhlE